LKDSVRPSDASWTALNPSALPGGGAAAGAAESRIVPNSDSVPSRLSMTSIVRLCWG
jgi:hypothetical protein